ncbi:MAG: glutathione S-transferase family protein [Gammaproteobacteria bacterium]
MKLYNAWYCPFAQRAWMALVYKDIKFDLIEIDPYDLTESWLEISRGAGLVPVVVQANGDGTDATIIESNRILEYLEDYYPGTTPIFAESPNQRAEQKFWMDHISNKITPHIYQLLKTQDAGEQRDESREQMLEGLAAFAGAMSSEGPYFCGERLSAVDIAMLPFSYRIDVLLGYYQKYALPREGEMWQRYHQWYEAMLALPAFRATAFDLAGYEDRLIKHYLTYTLGEGQTDVAEV